MILAGPPGSMSVGAVRSRLLRRRKVRITHLATWMKKLHKGLKGHKGYSLFRIIQVMILADQLRSISVGSDRRRLLRRRKVRITLLATWMKKLHEGLKGHKGNSLFRIIQVLILADQPGSMRGGLRRRR